MFRMKRCAIAEPDSGIGTDGHINNTHRVTDQSTAHNQHLEDLERIINDLNKRHSDDITRVKCELETSHREEIARLRLET